MLSFQGWKASEVMDLLPVSTFSSLGDVSGTLFAGILAEDVQCQQLVSDWLSSLASWQLCLWSAGVIQEANTFLINPPVHLCSLSVLPWLLCDERHSKIQIASSIIIAVVPQVSEPMLGSYHICNMSIPFTSSRTGECLLGELWSLAWDTPCLLLGSQTGSG